MKREFTFSVPATEEVSPSVRAIAEVIFKKVPLSRKGQNRLKLVFSEIFMNAVQHGSNYFNPVHLYFCLDDEKIKVMIADHGREESRVTAEEMRKIINYQGGENDVLTKTSGRGLAQIVQKWTDKFEIANNDHGGLVVSFEKDFQEEEEEIKEAPKATPKVVAADLPEVKFEFTGIVDETTIEEQTEPIDKHFEELKSPELIILDFDKTEFFLSTFIGKVVEWHRIATENGGDLKITNINQELYEILDLTGVIHLINITLKEKK